MSGRWSPQRASSQPWEPPEPLTSASAAGRQDPAGPRSAAARLRPPARCRPSAAPSGWGWRGAPRRESRSSPPSAGTATACAGGTGGGEGQRHGRSGSPSARLPAGLQGQCPQPLSMLTAPLPRGRRGGEHLNGEKLPPLSRYLAFVFPPDSRRFFPFDACAYRCGEHPQPPEATG